MIPKGTKVFGMKGTSFETVAAEATGSTRYCALEGCNGDRIYVRWPDGKLTMPCSKGLIEGPEPNSYRIG